MSASLHASRAAASSSASPPAAGDTGPHTGHARGAHSSHPCHTAVTWAVCAERKVSQRANALRRHASYAVVRRCAPPPMDQAPASTSDAGRSHEPACGPAARTWSAARKALPHEPGRLHAGSMRQGPTALLLSCSTSCRTSTRTSCMSTLARPHSRARAARSLISSTASEPAHACACPKP
eukprot:364918-Chlamydomonas_euryale.AAC.20